MEIVSVRTLLTAHNSWTVAALLFFAVMLSDGVRADSSTLDEDTKERIRWMEQALTHEIVLSGAVVDKSTGAALSGVDVEIRKGIFDPGARLLRRADESNDVVVGAFRYSCDSCLSMELSFRKKGYHSEKLHSSSFDTDQEAIKATRLRVELERRRDPVELDFILEELAVGHGGNAELLSQDSTTAKPTPAKPLVMPQGEEGLEGGPAPFLRLRAELDERGALKIQEIQQQQSAATPFGSVVLKPVGAAIDFSQADGGVIPYRPKAATRPRILREMSEAPAEGYQEGIDLDASATVPIFFFCKIGDRYGKGLVEALWIEQSAAKTQARALVQIWLNPGGTRSLVSLYD